jgi:hypothetical protein
MPPAAITRVVAQREDADCAVAAIAMYAGLSYENVLRAVVRHEPRFEGRRGLGDRAIRRILDELGAPVRLRRRVDYEDDFGLLRLEDHIVLLRNGLVVDDGQIWDVDAWRQTHGYVDDMQVMGIFVAVDA